MIYGSECNESGIDFYIMRKVDRNFMKNVKVTVGELQHNLEIVDIEDEKQIMKTEWKTKNQKLHVAKLRDESYKQLFECRVKENISDNHSDIC